MAAVKSRKTLMCLLSEKIGTLSMKSMIETNSGKLISLISSDLFTIERGLCITPMIFAAPFINLSAYAFIGSIVGWWYSLATFLFWVVIYVLQHTVTTISKKLKLKEGLINDNRVKMMTDLIVGIRTIKCYAWENLYLNKIK